MNKKILLVEDDEFIRELYRDELLRNGFEITACKDGEEGLKAIQQNQFDLVLLDIMLPGITGLELLKRIKQDPRTSGFKVVMLTNLGSDSVIQEGFNLGAASYLIKAAYNPDQIILEIRKLVADKSESAPTPPPTDNVKA